LYTWGIFLVYIHRRPSSRLRFCVLWEAGRDTARSPLYTFPQERSRPTNPLTWCLLHLTIVEPASSNEASTSILLLNNNEEDDLLTITKMAHKRNPITKSGFLALRFVVGKAFSQWTMRIKNKY